MRLDPARAEAIALLILPSLHRPYPAQLPNLMYSDGDARPPRLLTPMFYGCFDWHSAVHSHWSLVRLLRLFPGASWADEARDALSESFVAERAAAELGYLTDRPGFELPYGLSWLLQLDAELGEGRDDAQMRGWRSVLQPLVDLAASRMVAWLQRLRHPIRGGEHSQSAFAMGLALDWARSVGRSDAAEVIAGQARRFHGSDRDAPLAYEPSAYDFLSPSLAEADLMRRVLDSSELDNWLAGFLPEGAHWEPVEPVDRADGKLAHFDGLNLSRAWMMRGIASALPGSHPRRAGFMASAGEHERAGMNGVDGRHYAGSHWLGSFAIYLLTDRGIDAARR